MKKRLVIILGIFLLLSLVYQQKIPHILLGKYLSPSDVLNKADAIVVVSGDGDRMKHAIDLYKQRYAPKLILSGATKDGFTSNALYTKEIILSQEMKNIILVSSPYHQRRAYETFRSVFRGSGIKLQNSPSIYSSWKTDSWWETDRELHLTQEEAIKILWVNITGNYK